MAKKDKKTTHVVGKRSGYELRDGVYYLAPMYVDAFAKLADRSEGIDQSIRSVARHVAEINKEIASEKRNLWDRIYEDLGLDKSKAHKYRSSDGAVQVIEDKVKSDDKD